MRRSSPPGDVEVAPVGEAKVVDDVVEDNELFKVDGEVQYRTMGWMKTAMVFTKAQFAIGVLSIPAGFSVLGALGALTTYGALLMGNFRLRHKGIHTIVDAGTIMGGPILREICGVFYILGFVLSTSASMLSITIGLNALSDHAICTVWFSLVAMVLTLIFACFPRFGQIGVLTWAGFFSVVTAVLIVVIAVTTLSRPAAAPAGAYDLGFNAIAHPNFVNGMTSSNTILVSLCGTPAFMTAASEMRRPRDYPKSVYWSMGFTVSSYLTFSLVVYRWCGQYVASPALGSAGPLIKKISYGIGLPGLVISSCLYLHICSKYTFVRILRNSRHLQEKTKVHYLTWYGTSLFMAILSWVVAEAVPFFTSLIGLIIVFVGPLAICVPMAMWFYDHRKMGTNPNLLAKVLHGFLFLVGAFVAVGGAYSACQQIADQYAAGTVGSAFSCADNSNSS
ncbi:hypothetical protein EHS25_000287 [Saitozyma podzolica]|uniref:Amino acid transporter transmembrane domain-containing protein n=1 Tax=Saitozyma podzolica TaxID=1890683 RepID=A0A427YW21_9TREE|nr:hypothetical protein EHS25_000287 [Saitozyma podzolica]